MSSGIIQAINNIIITTPTTPAQTVSNLRQFISPINIIVIVITNKRAAVEKFSVKIIPHVITIIPITYQNNLF